MERFTKEDLMKATKEKKRFWKFPRKWKRMGNKTQKNLGMLLVQYISIKGEITMMTVPMKKGFIIVRGNPHFMDPKQILSMRIGVRTYRIYIIREIDHLPVSNMDYDEIKEDGRCTDDDELIIKAALNAVLVEGNKKVNPKMIVWLVILLLVIGVGYAFFTSGV